MGHFLFIDESGHDRGASPYEVLAGIAIEDKEIWNLVQRVHDLEVDCFGMRISEGSLELKGSKLLKRKTFRLASQMPSFPESERTALAKVCLEKGKGIGSSDPVTKGELTALGQAKIAFTEKILELCAAHRARAFASIVEKQAEYPANQDFLRKDYAFLFERFFYYLEDRPGDPMGIVVFDELEKSKCHILLNQMAHYFVRTAKGRMRSARIIPEPFFVHSELTSAIQLADIAAYVISWAVRFGGMSEPIRPELAHLAELVCQLRYTTTRPLMGREDFEIRGFAVIDNLRPRDSAEK